MSIITNVRTIRLEQFPNSIWVEIETDENLTGLGEAWRGTAGIEGVAGAGVINLNGRAGCSAQGLINRDAVAFSGQIPEGNINGAGCPDFRAGTVETYIRS